MPQVVVVFNQILMLGLLCLTGFIAGRKKYLPENSGVILSGIVVKLTAPLLILTTMTNYSFTGKDVFGGIHVYLFGIFFILFSFIIAKLACKGLKLENHTESIYKIESMFGNVVYLAYPLLTALYGEKGLIYAVFYSISQDTLLWTLGIYLLNKHGANRWKDNLKHLINGNTIAFALGIFSIAINFQYFAAKIPWIQKTYQLLYNAFNPLGKTTIYLSMLFIGLILSGVRVGGLKGFFRRYPIFVLSFLKLLLVPVIVMLIMTVLSMFFNIDPFVRTIIVLQMAMPCSTIVAALAAQHNSDYEFASECIFFTTIFGLGTLPFIVILLNLL